MKKPNTPFNLKLLAWLFILIGAAFVADTSFGLPHGEIRLHVPALNLFIGIGLLRRGRIWRYIAMAALGLASGVCLIIILLMVFPNVVTLRYTLYGHSISKPAGTVMTFTGLVLAGWGYRVLRQPEARRLFIPPGER